MDQSDAAGGDRELADLRRRLRVLTPEQLAQIDRLLREVGPSGEVRLIVQKGRVRYLTTVETTDLPAVDN